MTARVNSQWLELGRFQSAVDARLEAWRREGNVRRLWEKDASLWTSEDEDRWLGWLDVVSRQIDSIGVLNELQKEAARGGFEDAVVLGMGGSSLCPEVLSRTFGPRPGFPQLLVLDSTVPAQILTLEKRLDLHKSLFVVASKSGTTAEPNALESYFFDRVGRGSQFIAITDPGTPLESMARAKRYRHLFHGEPEIGGRFSALSPFGMVPAAIAGVHVVRFLERAAVMVEACGPEVSPESNPGVELGIALGVLASEGRDKLTIETSPMLASLASWIEQLVAESTGKNGRGIVPVCGEPGGAPDRYGDDRVFVELRFGDEAVPDVPPEHPLIRIHVPTREDLAQELFRWEMATAVAGAVMGLNPFDQPDVEASKVKTRELVARYQATGELPADDGAHFPTDDALRAHLESLAPGDYFAVNAYIEMDVENMVQLQLFRKAVRDRYRVATTVGFGPRFLHSTGQLHKGGANRGVFLQITCDDASDIPIPGQDLTFGQLKQFQAQGDFEVLVERKRRLMRAHVGADVGAGLSHLAALA